ncbi:hypothetical protein L596_008761 [Steinernema carpocapsae]|uniref:G-protein coupled receptors family 1 profile domain-containing protein n=1 Tax=Steinernema carpocapsae TaxID=34508 RepID=A0A4V6A6G5_STECR|nr:hypothetical protein L596_008761 [Steinernema carpocapsae]
MFSYETFLYEYYDVFVKQYLLFSCSIAVTVLNVLCLYFYLRRCFDSTSRFGMIFMLFVTHIAYGCFNVLSYGSDLLPEYLFNFVKNSPRLFVLIFTLSQISQQIVAVSSAFVAVDRVLVMAGPIKYGYYKITRKLAWLAAILNIGLFFMLIGACLIIPKDAFVLKTSTIVRYYIFSPTLLIEAFLYVVFLLQFRSYVRCRTNAVAKQLTAQVGRKGHDTKSKTSTFSATTSSCFK